MALALLLKAKESTSDVRGGCGQHVLPFSVYMSVCEVQTKFLCPDAGM